MAKENANSCLFPSTTIMTILAVSRRLATGVANFPVGHYFKPLPKKRTVQRNDIVQVKPQTMKTV